MGTCSSLPILYLAVGRRLSYPLKLVPTKNHLFVRWEDDRFRFNIDATGVGMNVYDDEHYRQWPFPVTGEELAEFGYLKSMTASEELTAFLSLRGQCLMSMGKAAEAVACQEAALRFSPASQQQQLIVAKAREEMALRTVRWDLLPPEQLRHGSIPWGALPHEIEVQLAVQQAEYLSRQKRGELPVLNSQPQGVPGFAPVVSPDPDPLKKIQNQFKSP
jgi:hypothetical protein